MHLGVQAHTYDISGNIYLPLSPCTLSWAQRYYYYINNGIDTSHVAPLEDSWLLHVLGRIADKHKVRRLLLHSGACVECQVVQCYLRVLLEGSGFSPCLSPRLPHTVHTYKHTYTLTYIHTYSTYVRTYACYLV